MYGGDADIAFAAHLGGVAGGAIAALLLRRTLPAAEQRRTERLEQPATTICLRRAPVVKLAAGR